MVGRQGDGAHARNATRGRARRRWGSALLVGGIVVGASATVSVGTPAGVYSAAVRLLGTTVGVGPSFDGFGASIPLFFFGTVVPQGDSFHVVPYPAQINLDYPIVSELPALSDFPYWPQSLKRSEAVGAGYLERDIAALPAGEKVTIIGMSQGTQVAEIARAAMARDPNYVANAGNYEFVLVGDPYQPNGGILSRFTSWSGRHGLGDVVPFGRPGPSDSPFKTTFYQNQYDGFADFPAYFNVPAVLNAALGIVFGHVFPGYVFESRRNPNVVSTTVGNTTYVTFPQYLPLLMPFRLAASLIGAQRLVDALDPILRVFVEMGYDRTADPGVVKEFSWTTPEQKVQEARDALPNAFAQALAILGGADYTPTVAAPEVAAADVATPVTEHPALPVDTSAWAQAVHQVAVNLSTVLTAVTRSFAELLAAIGGQAPSHVDTAPGDVPAPLAVPPADAPRTARSAAPVAAGPDPVDSRAKSVVRQQQIPHRADVRAPGRSAAASPEAADPAPSPRPVERVERDRADTAPAPRDGRGRDRAAKSAHAGRDRSARQHGD